jgi:hypothetical protein
MGEDLKKCGKVEMCVGLYRGNRYPRRMKSVSREEKQRGKGQKAEE